MKKIILIIFLCIIFTFIIFNAFPHKKKILVLGDKYILKSIDKISEQYVIDTFIYDTITYDELIKSIKTNDYIISKNEKKYLNQLISSSDKIILSANNDQFNNKCHKNNEYLEEYSDKIYDEYKRLENLLKKISHAEIIVIGNSCPQKNNKLSKYLANKYFGINYVNTYNNLLNLDKYIN